MASRKDSKGYALRTGETQRAENVTIDMQRL